MVESRFAFDSSGGPPDRADQSRKFTGSLSFPDIRASPTSTSGPHWPLRSMSTQQLPATGGGRKPVESRFRDLRNWVFSV